MRDNGVPRCIRLGDEVIVGHLKERTHRRGFIALACGPCADCGQVGECSSVGPEKKPAPRASAHSDNSSATACTSSPTFSQMLIVGLAWQLGVVVILMGALLWMGCILPRPPGSDLHRDDAVGGQSDGTRDPRRAAGGDVGRSALHGARRLESAALGRRDDERSRRCPMITAAMLSLALNLVLTGVFILLVK